jgi:hypothetical protein
MRKAVAFTLLLLTAALAFATPTALTPITLKQNNYAVAAADLAITFTACDNVNGNSFVASGTEILLVQNTDASAHTFTVTSVPDPYGRVDTSLTGYSVPANQVHAIQISQTQGWVTAGNVVTLGCSSALIKFAVLRHN